MTRSSLAAAKTRISDTFDASEKRVFKRSEMARLLQDQKATWGVAASVGVDTFIEFLVRNGKLHKVALRFPSREETRYAWGDATPYELAVSLRPRSYLSHHSAAYLNGIAAVEPKRVYANSEQPGRSIQSDTLTQESLDLAFSRKPRVTHNTAAFGQRIIFLLNGMNTKDHQVIERPAQWGRVVRVTSLERTLMDMTVRPVYSGGPQSVLDAYRSARGQFSVEVLVEVLERLNYTYPYHQAVGFYLERAGSCNEESLGAFLSKPMNYNFYLANRMGATLFSERWRLYYPANLR